MLNRVMQMQHFVEHHVFERELRRVEVVENSADHDEVVRRIVMPEARARTNVAPSKGGPRHHASEVAGIQVFENFFEIVNQSARTFVNLAPALQLDGPDLAPHIFTIQV